MESGPRAPTNLYELDVDARSSFAFSVRLVILRGIIEDFEVLHPLLRLLGLNDLFRALDEKAGNGRFFFTY
jgi:hypothetical protein